MTKLLFSSSALTVMVMGINFLFKVYLSHNYSKDFLGIFYTFIDVVSLGIVLFAGFKDSLVVALDRYQKEKVLYLYTIFFSVITLVVVVVEMFYFSSFAFDISYLSFFLFFFFNVVAIYLSYLNSGYKNYKVMVFESSLFTFALIGSFFLLKFFIDGFSLFVGIYLVAYGVRIIYLWYFVRGSFTWQKTPFLEYKKFFYNTALSSLMYFFSGLFINLSGVVILKLFGDKALLGEYQVVVRSIFFALVAVFVFPLNSLLFPKISEYIANKEIETLQKVYKNFLWYLAGFYLLVALFMAVMPFAISFVFPPNYAHSAIYINYLLPTLPLIAYTTFTLNIIKGFDRFDLALYVRVFGSLAFFGAIAIFYLLHFQASSIFFAFDIAFVVMAFFAWYFKQRLLS